MMVESLLTNPPSSLRNRKTRLEVRGKLQDKRVSLFGGALTHVVFGSFYCLPNLSSYLPSELRRSEHLDALLAMPLILLFSAVGMPLGASLARRSLTGAALLGGWTIALSSYLASCSRSCSDFLLTHGVLFGFGVGLGYTAPLAAGWQQFGPQRRGFVSGATLAGFGAAAFVWNPLVTALANPMNIAPPFPPQVTANARPILRKLAGAYCLVTSIGVAAMASSLPRSVGKEEELSSKRNLWSPLRTSEFWLAWCLCLFAGTAALSVATLWKDFAVASLTSLTDRSLAKSGAVAALCNGVGRIAWATLSDKLGLFRTFLALLSLQTVAILAFLRPSAFFFSANLGIIFACLGGIFSLGPPLATTLFGPDDGPRVYGLLFSSFPISSLAGQLLRNRGGGPWLRLFGFFATSSALAFLPLLRLAPKLAAAPSRDYSSSTASSVGHDR